MEMQEKRKRIAVSGKSGCGNTTVRKLAADTLGLE
jgi:cytidylate kinase